jgi:hypothetical protein
MADLPEIYGAGITLHPDQFPRIAGVSIEKQLSMPIISGLAFGYERRKKHIVITDRGFATLVHDNKKLAMTDLGQCVNLNPNNPNNLIYQVI